MAELPPSSSQDSIYDRHRIILDQENIGSSPLKLRGVSIPTSPKKQKTAPTVTPRRFKRFFTPRSSASSKGYRQSKAGRQLRDITKNGINRQPKFRTLFPDDPFSNGDEDSHFCRSPKRRRISLDITSSPPISSPIKGGVRTPAQLSCFEDALPSPTISEVPSLPMFHGEFTRFPSPVQRLRPHGRTRRILERSFGEYHTAAPSFSLGRRRPDHVGNPLAATANFVTTPTDMHDFHSSSIPFCTAACNTNSLVAIGDEEGIISLIDSSPEFEFTRSHLKIHAHHNAIMDVAFSSDDRILATACGDQSSRLIDMTTQSITCNLIGHTSTVKQVRFSPTSDNIIYTSSKDGTVQIWDLRRGSSAALGFRTSTSPVAESRPLPDKAYSQTVLEAFQGHRLATRPLADLSRPELSITAIHHMPHGREHLLLTASEVNAAIKLWDLRNANRKLAVPLSSTEIPESHTRTRNYGINALSVSGDRLYATCRDATVYVYSTTQLALGCVPEMSAQPSRRRMLKEPHKGAAPLYGFRHPSLRLDSFYCKASLRPCKEDRDEVLVVGNTEKCPVVFPTDERHFTRRERRAQEDIPVDETELPTMPLNSSQPPASGSSTIPIYQHGTALVGAHTREVTSVTWSHGGDLVSVSDDYTARCWREDAEKARHLRTCGESGGERWCSGWAEVDPTWDEEEL